PGGDPRRPLQFGGHGYDRARDGREGRVLAVGAADRGAPPGRMDLPLLPQWLRVHLRHRGYRHTPERAGGGRRAALAGSRLQRPVLVSRGHEAALEARGRHVDGQTAWDVSEPVPDKPSKNEEEYFARRDAELLRQQRDAAH